MNTGTFLSRLLERYDVQHVFGIPGVHTLELYRGLADTSIVHITPRHEQGAGFMADGYARLSGKPGVCFIISGPGMTNILTAMGQAWSDSIPMLVISTVNAHGRMGSGNGWLHELKNQQALVSGVCEFSHTVNRAAELPSVVARAFAVFDSARPRPVHIEIPTNVLKEDLNPVFLPAFPSRLCRPSGDARQCELAAEHIQNARNPVILTGGGAISAHVAVRQFAEQIDAPVVMTINGRGILADKHPLAVGASASLPSVRALIQAADIVIALGTEFGSTDYDFNEDGQFDIPGMLIRIDIDPQQLMRTRIPELGIVGSVEGTLQAICNNLGAERKQCKGEQRAALCRQQVNASISAREQRYLELLHMINSSIENPVIVGDSTQIIYAANSAFAAVQPGSYFNSATGFGTLGYALPAAVGAALAAPERNIVAITGDGGIQFCLAELGTACDTKARIVVIVHHNGGYAEIKTAMCNSGIEPVGVDLQVPDMTALATAYGWRVRRITELSELADILTVNNKDTTPLLLQIDDAAFEI